MTIKPIETYTLDKQEFLNSVLNKIGKQEFSNTKYKNPLKRIIGGFIENATDIEEIYVERSQDIGYDPEGNGVLDREKPTVSVQYHRETIEHGYKATIQYKQMRKGFLNKNSLGTMADTIIQQLHTGKEVDEYTDCINTLKSLVERTTTLNNVISVKPVVDETTAKAFIKAIKKTIPKMSEYTTNFSEKANSATPSDLILFLDSDTEVEMEVEWLASAFNMDVTKLNETTKIVIPNMKAKMGAIGVLCHHKCIKINPCYYDIDSIKNSRGKFINYDLVTETLLSHTTWYPYAIIKDNLK